MKKQLKEKDFYEMDEESKSTNFYFEPPATQFQRVLHYHPSFHSDSLTSRLIRWYKIDRMDTFHSEVSVYSHRHGTSTHAYKLNIWI